MHGDDILGFRTSYNKKYSKNQLNGTAPNSMVEASHRLIETEWYDDMYLPTYQGFFRDVAHYNDTLILNE